jgi:hypothetical protein
MPGPMEMEEDAPVIMLITSGQKMAGLVGVDDVDVRVKTAGFLCLSSGRKISALSIIASCISTAVSPSFRVELVDLRNIEIGSFYGRG